MPPIPLIVAMEPRTGSTAIAARLLTVQPNQNWNKDWPQGEWNVLSSVCELAKELCYVRNDLVKTSTVRTGPWPGAVGDPYFRYWDVLQRNLFESMRAIANGLWSGVAEALGLEDGYFVEKLMNHLAPIGMLLDNAHFFWGVRNPIDKIASHFAGEEYRHGIRRSEEEVYQIAKQAAQGDLKTQAMMARMMKIRLPAERRHLIPFEWIKDGRAWSYLAERGFPNDDSVERTIPADHAMRGLKEKFRRPVEHAVREAIPAHILEAFHEAEKSMEGIDRLMGLLDQYCSGIFPALFRIHGPDTVKRSLQIYAEVYRSG